MTNEAIKVLLKRWYNLLCETGNNTKGQVRKEIETVLKNIEEAAQNDKETPKEVIRTPYKDICGNKLEDNKSHFYNGCPVCKGNVGIDANYCRHCGQRIYWKID